jgi:hypothetical protein
MAAELEKRLEGSGRGLLDVWTCHFAGVTERGHKNFQLT